MSIYFGNNSSGGGADTYVTQHPLQTGAFTWPLNRSYYVSERDCLVGIINEGNSKTRVIQNSILIGATLTAMAATGAVATVTVPILVEFFKNSAALTLIDDTNFLPSDWITFKCDSTTGLIEVPMLTTDHYSIKMTSPADFLGVMTSQAYNVQLLWQKN